jgi:exodeoxyribonuclease V beta subunit
MSAASETLAPASWRELSLDEGGRSLIEASAGTGKTWTISLLYLRLLLERELSPKQIVVTTFTDAAAQELRERLRGRLVWAGRQAKGVLEETGEPQAEVTPPEQAWLHERWSTGSAIEPDAAKVRADLNRLRLAEAELDLAPIGTLHGLCRKILSDFPFESGSAFEMGEMVSSQSLMGSLAEDVWRQLQQGSEPSDAWAVDSSSLGDLKKRLTAYAAPGVTLRLPEAFTVPLLPELAGPIRKLTETKVFTTKRTFKSALQCLAAYLESAPHERGLLPKRLDQLTPIDLSEHIAPHGLADPAVMQVIQYAMDVGCMLQDQARIDEVAPWLHWVEQIKVWREQRLAASGRLTFDELIERVYRALPETGSALADRLFEAWPVAMVDEFQDTDAQQYAILDRIYRDRDGRHRGRLVMIGDPKQAIYRFRGGDIDAYLEARLDATSQLNLDTNFRSSRELVAAFNEFYRHAGTRLSSQPAHQVVYQPVKASARCDSKPYRINGEICARPLQFHYWSENVPDDAASRVGHALTACANHIVELLGSGQHAIGDKPLQPGDIAVLLPGNYQVTQLRDLLRERQVPCVSSTRSSVFDSDWARELQIVLYAIHHPRDEAVVRAALATRLGGTSYAELRELREQSDAWQHVASRFGKLGTHWQSRGVLAVVQELISDAAERLFTAGDSERALTDLRHLGELLQAKSEELTGPEQLLTWLADQRGDHRDDSGESADEMQLRIESDAKRVRLMTLHASKGLEFPLVLLPLMWNSKHSSRDTIPILHDASSRQRVVGFGGEARMRYQQEGQDERFRLLYVALTRARYACHVYALPPDRPAKASSGPRAAPADTDPTRAPLDAMLERAQRDLGENRTLQSVSRHLLWSSAGWPWQTATYASGADATAVPRHVWSEPRTPKFEFKYSFSALTKLHGISTLEEAAASDENAVPEPSHPDASLIDAGPIDMATDGDGSTPIVVGINARPAESAHPQLQWLAPIAGADFGNALHAIFELREVGRPMAVQHALIRRCLQDQGVRMREITPDALVPHLAERVQATLDAVLLPGTALTLAALPARHLRAEMEFHFMLGEVSMQRLRTACAEHGEPELVPPTSARTLRGLMNGKIDLVFQYDGRFHVLDYKSNRLGESRLSDYAPAQLALAMDQHNYRFQALLYTVAVDRYLRQRIPGYLRSRHMGEAIYLFVRATGLAPGVGIWTHRFDDALIDAVDAVLATPPQEAA